MAAAAAAKKIQIGLQMIEVMQVPKQLHNLSVT